MELVTKIKKILIYKNTNNSKIASLPGKGSLELAFIPESLTDYMTLAGSIVKKGLS